MLDAVAPVHPYNTVPRVAVAAVNIAVAVAADRLNTVRNVDQTELLAWMSHSRLTLIASSCAKFGDFRPIHVQNGQDVC